MIEDKVSIIIPVFNQLKYTRECIDNLIKYTDVDFEIIVVNNGSIDHTKAYLKKHPEIISINNDTNLGFARGCNQGIKKARGKYVVILNNDCLVFNNWLSKMIKLAKKDQIGIVGVMSNFVNKVQLIKTMPHEGEELNDFAARIGKIYNQEFFYSERIVGLCMLINKELIQKIGGFDPLFGLGNFEDDDLCVRSLLSGYKNVVAKDVFVFHYGSTTFKGEKINRRKLLNENWEKFKEKWHLPQETIIKPGYLNNLLKRNYDLKDLYIPLE